MREHLAGDGVTYYMKGVSNFICAGAFLAAVVSAAAFSTRPIPNEEPYRESELPPKLELTSRQLAIIKRDIDRNMRQPYQPEGKLVEVYATGVTTVDGWLSMTLMPDLQAPVAPSFYRFVYRDGYLTETYRHDATGVRLSSRILYDFRKAPVLSVNYAPDGGVLWYGYLTYDNRGLIKRVMHIHLDFKPWFATCFVQSDQNVRVEESHYQFNRGGIQTSHHKTDGPPHPGFQRLEKLGVRPIYPPLRVSDSPKEEPIERRPPADVKEPARE